MSLWTIFWSWRYLRVETLQDLLSAMMTHLDVPVNNLLVVEILEPFQDLLVL